VVPGSTASNLLLATLSVVVALGAAELALRTVQPPLPDYLVLAPGTYRTPAPAPGILPGVTGASAARVNRFGLRGRTFGDDRAEFRILAVGGSTTRCSVLDDTEVWTHLLEVGLGRTADGRRVWVGNAGRDGATTRDYVLHLKYLLRQYPRIDVVVVLAGVNDLMSALHQGWSYRLPVAVTEPSAEAEEMGRAFAVVLGGEPPPRDHGSGEHAWYRATALWQLGRRVKVAWQAHRTVGLHDVGEHFLEAARLHRRTAGTWFDSLPPLGPPLTEYHRNLDTMADLATAAGARLVLVTQPSAWRNGMSDAEERLLWFGWVGGDVPSAWAYFTTRALARAMARYNDVLLAVCHERGLDCVDAATLIPRDTTALYDDVHFNEHGSHLFAQALVERFRRGPPFRSPN